MKENKKYTRKTNKNFPKSTLEKREKTDYRKKKDENQRTENSKRPKPYAEKRKPYPTKRTSFVKNRKKQAVENEELIRLNRYIANAGICSRREADEYISKGLIEVNGKIVTELGTKVSRKDTVKFNKERINPEKKVYILLNKPKDCVTTLDDPHAKRTVMDFVKNACKERIYPVGRLDRNTTGVLLLTNDGKITAKLTHPKFNKKKIYHVFLDKNVTKSDLEQLVLGVELDDGLALADVATYIDNDKKQVGLEIHSGRNRIVRRMFEHFGYKVTKLDRVYFGGLTKKKLSRGKWRFLTEKEISRLKMGAFE